MPPLDSWLQISIRTPLWALFLLVILLVGVGVWARAAWKRRRAARAVAVAQADRSEQMEQQRRAEDAYLQFLYNASHEVANPLQTILTNLDNMATCTPEEAGRWRQYHTVISQDVRRLVKLTDNLRLLARLETPSGSVTREPVNIKGVIEGVIMAQVEIAEALDVHLSYVGPERPARVLGNRDHLTQVMMNLVDNGIKYAREGGGKVVISVQDEGDRLCVRVADDGIGIPESDLPHIFDTAYRAHDPRSVQRKGSGLGLAIVRRIIEQHGGEVRVSSRVGEGTEFAFELPVFTQQ